MSNTINSASVPFAALAAIAATVSLAGCGPEASDSTGIEQQDTESVAVTDDTPASLPRSAAPAAARVFFVTPADGSTVSNPVVLEFGVENMAIARAGVNEPASGHHHLIIDADLPDLSAPIPVSDNYIHFGDGSTRTERVFEPGSHTLQLLLGDHLHIPHDPPISSEIITIVVE